MESRGDPEKELALRMLKDVWAEVEPIINAFYYPQVAESTFEILVYNCLTFDGDPFRDLSDSFRTLFQHLKLFDSWFHEKLLPKWREAITKFQVPEPYGRNERKLYAEVYIATTVDRGDDRLKHAASGMAFLDAFCEKGDGDSAIPDIPAKVLKTLHHATRSRHHE